MIINNNIPAMNTHRQMGINQNNMQESMEKLSSGLRINNASDDAAGLAISEKMRGQINGLEQASNNAQDGISMIQTAEGALNESHSILQRMRELGTQAANDTNVEVDRDEIQKEMNSLTSEINRIGNTTEFNTQNLLNGGEEAADLTASTTGTGEVSLAGAVEEVQGEWNISIDTAIEDGNSIDIGGVTVTADNGGTAALEIDETADEGTQADELADALMTDDNFTEKYTATSNGDGSITVKENEGEASGTSLATDYSGATGAGTVSETEPVTSVAEADPKLTIDTDFVAGDTLTVGEETYTFGNNSEDFDVDLSSTSTTGEQADALASVIAEQSGVESAVSNGSTISIEQGGGDGFSANFQIGANEGQAMTVEIGDMRAEALGISGAAGGNAEGNAVFAANENVTNGTDNQGTEAALDVSTHENATAAVTAINDAIESVSAERSSLGASQNRLEHTISNLDNSAENLQSAESRIRDVDMAAEMMEQTKASTLSQASQSMLAQANQQPQQVLQLLQ